MKVFLSYPFDDDHPEWERFVPRVNYFLRKQPDLDSCCYTEERKRPDWPAIVSSKLVGCDAFVLFVGGRFGPTQHLEADTFETNWEKQLYGRTVTVEFPHAVPLPERFSLFRQRSVKALKTSDSAAEDCAKKIARHLRERLEPDAGPSAHTPEAESDEESDAAALEPKDPWIPSDGLPLGYPFDYEKEILREYVEGGSRLLDPRRLEQGCPRAWPKVERIEFREYDNPVDESVIGTYRGHDKEIILTNISSNPDVVLTFPEAGPRANLRYPQGGADKLKVGIVVTGGIAPGINAVIAGILERHRLYEKKQEEERRERTERKENEAPAPAYKLEICLYHDGFAGILRGSRNSVEDETVRDRADRGGSMIGTSRFDKMLDQGDRAEQSRHLDQLIAQIRADHIDILYVIGGDGSMRAAHAIWTRMKKDHDPRKVSIVGIPKTMDNDILWVWQSFGFLSAVERAKDAIHQLHTEVTSNPRLCVMQLFGSDSGFVVSHAALASSGNCDAALIPEIKFSMKGLSNYIREDVLRQRGKSPHGLILLAETAVPQDVEDYIDDPRYPELGLEEKEKEAIRNFVGSSLLNVSDIRFESQGDGKKNDTEDDIKAWAELRRRLRAGGEADAPGPIRRVWELLRPEIKGVIIHADDEQETDAALKSLVVKALNDVLRDADFYREEDFKEVEGPPIYELLTVARRMGSDGAPLTDEELQTLTRGPSIPLPYDAKEVLKQLPGGDNLSASERERLSRRFIESINRLLLEAALSEPGRPDVIAKNLAARGERRVHGQTPDELRTGGLKIVARVLQSDIRNRDLMRGNFDYWKDFRVFTNEPRHLLRAISPSASDVAFGHRLGILAVDNAMAGYTDFMVSQWVTEYVLVPLKLVVLGRKRVPEDGIFWRSVLANTRQPPRM